MRADAHEFSHTVDTLIENVRELLDSPNAHDRVRGARHLAAGAELLERQVLLEAQASGMTWAEIGGVYGVSRQAAHRRFADETVVPSDFLDTLLQDLEEPPEVVPSLARAAERMRKTATTR